MLQVRGTIHLAADDLHDKAIQIIDKTIAELVSQDGVSCDLETWPQSPPTPVNDAKLARESRAAIKAVVGAANVIELKAPWPFNGEDFAYYQQHMPGVFYFLGAANRARGIMSIPHTPEFDVDEDCLLVGVKVAAGVLLNYLGNTHKEI